MIMWPASALLTGNGVAFVLRVPGTQHGDWWSTRGWWIFVATAGGALLSKHVIKWRREHIFNPSNIGLVVVFLALGRARVEPLDFWWGPMSWWMALALVIIVSGGFTILARLELLRVALSFWAAFAVGIGGLALAGHVMTARWHLGPISGFYFWWVLVTSPEVLVFLFFMITDPKTAPRGLRERVGYGITLGVLASVLIAPTRTEFAAKVALLSALAIVCLGKALLQTFPVRVDRTRLALATAAGVAGLCGRGDLRDEPGAVARCAEPAPGNAAADHDPAVARRPDPARPPHGRADRLRPDRGEARPGGRLAPDPSRGGHRPGAADRGGAAREQHVSPARERRRRVVSRHRVPAAAGRGGAEERCARPEPVDRRRVIGRSRLPAGLVPLRDLERNQGDDGRRALLARLQQRRLARSLRRQLVRERRHCSTGSRTAACRAPLCSRTCTGRSATSAQRRTRTSQCRATAASPPTSTATAGRTSSSRRRTASRCSGTTATAPSREAAAPQA